MNHKFMKQKKWNPINKRNMEDVYNREKKIEESNQKAKEKLATLQKERVTMEFEKMSDGSVTYAKDPRAWIQRLLPNSEATQRDQLLGKVEINLNTKNEDSIKTGMNIPGTSVSESNVSTSMNEASRRVHEDPLFLIQQEDMRNRQRLLQNPKTINLLKEKLSQLGYNQTNSNETTSQHNETKQNNTTQPTVNNNHHNSHHHHHHHRQYNRHSNSNRSDSESSVHHSNRHRSRSRSQSYHHHDNDHNIKNTNTSLTSNSHNIKPQQTYYKRPSRSTHHMTEEEKQKQLEEMSKNAEINQELKNKRLLEGHKSDLQSQQEQTKHKEDFHHNPNFIQEFRKEAYMGNNKS